MSIYNSFVVPLSLVLVVSLSLSTQRTLGDQITYRFSEHNFKVSSYVPIEKVREGDTVEYFGEYSSNSSIRGVMQETKFEIRVTPGKEINPKNRISEIVGQLNRDEEDKWFLAYETPVYQDDCNGWHGTFGHEIDDAFFMELDVRILVCAGTTYELSVLHWPYRSDMSRRFFFCRDLPHLTKMFIESFEILNNETSEASQPSRPPSLLGTWFYKSRAVRKGWHFDADRRNVYIEGLTGRTGFNAYEMHPAEYRVNESTSPMQLDVRKQSSDPYLKGIYRYRGKTLEVCIARSSDLERPSKFEETDENDFYKFHRPGGFYVRDKLHSSSPHPKNL